MFSFTKYKNNICSQARNIKKAEKKIEARLFAMNAFDVEQTERNPIQKNENAKQKIIHRE